ncbi:zeta toxin family protein [Luteolibacter soli]|uniref:Zeta toxin family protein n=1 Tax=Luteolibacter soli TaxID=3135280 RepID=A0ABU9B5F1_9BACT
MNDETPRMRMFAGPNGSGKSVLKSYLPEPLLGVYLNPDEIEAGVNTRGYLDFRDFGLASLTAAEVLPNFIGSDFLSREGFGGQAARLTFANGRLDFPPGVMNAYFASVAADMIRQALVARKATFTFETVMSHPGKVSLLQQAQAEGYRTYLYYVATEDPAINISRVANRVALGGHAVPEGKIVERYHRSLGLLMEAIRHSHRAYIFDNSTDNADGKHTWLAEITEGRKLELKTDRIPSWFKRAVMDPIT